MLPCPGSSEIFGVCAEAYHSLGEGSGGRLSVTSAQDLGISKIILKSEGRTVRITGISRA
jgi:hypothetical protein